MTPYHPQSDGQMERFNQTLGAMLATMVAPDKTDWDLHLPCTLPQDFALTSLCMVVRSPYRWM